MYIFISLPPESLWNFPNNLNWETTSTDLKIALLTLFCINLHDTTDAPIAMTSVDSDSMVMGQEQYRVANRPDKVIAVNQSIRQFSPHQLYNKMRQIDEWADTLDAKEGMYTRFERRWDHIHFAPYFMLVI